MTFTNLLVKLSIPALLVIYLSGCSDSTKSFEELSDEEKHLPENAVLGLDTREGLHTTLFASEEMLVNPTNMDIDYRGRVWITEGYNYRSRLNPDNPTKEEGDRIVILEDTNNDGKADSSKVFYQGNDINSALGILVLDNRVIVSRSPDVFIFTDTNGDDKADKKEILFTGVGGEEHDHGIHAFVFGPDGKLYFNFGNSGTTLKDKNGEVVKDQFGRPVTSEGKPFRQGMVFRCNLDGSDLEVLGHNFRNNYEVAVDAFGTLWQSDNDDDGNRGVRINYVMEYGNYGYTDELTGAGWRTRRIGMDNEIPIRHWHQHDPGVIPNLLQTGAGSPTGLTIYEGRLLPEIFWNQMIHTDAGPNVVRAYPVTNQGAGYQASIENLLVGDKNPWFRPSDVTVAPDGSVFVSDWYDPGVGGHQMGDQGRGRVFRIAPEGAPFDIPTFDFSTPQGATEALKSPNLNVRTKAWMALKNWEGEAETALLELWDDENPRFQARALWLLSKLEGKGVLYIDQSLDHDNPDLRICGLRAARQLDIPIIPYLQRLGRDPSPQVRREVAIALYGNKSPEAAGIWSQLASQHDGEDRWYLEALGIGADGQWGLFMSQWLKDVGSDWNNPAGRDIIWRSRAERAIPLLTQIIKDPTAGYEQKIRYFRAFEFHDSPTKTAEIISILKGNLPDQERLNYLALRLLDPSDLKNNALVRSTLNKVLESTKGTFDFVDLVGRFELKDKNKELLELVISYPDSTLGVSAVNHMLRYAGNTMIESTLKGEDGDQSDAVMRALGRSSLKESFSILQSFLLDENNELPLRRKAVTALGVQAGGEVRLVELLKKDMIADSLMNVTAVALSDSWRQHFRQIANEILQKAPTRDTELVVSELLARKGDAENGKAVFGQSCQVCHRVDGKGIQFGPDLSEIGNKLPKEALLEAILEPNAGISFGYEGYILTLNDQSMAAGIIQSETETEVVLLDPTGNTTTYDQSRIKSKEQMKQSLMPGLASTFTQAELVDLVEYLSSLK